MTTQTQSDHRLQDAPTATVEKDDHVAIITMQNPPNNVLTAELRRELLAILAGLEADTDVRAVVIASNQANYTAGGDLKEDQSLSDEEVRQYVSDFSEVIDRIDEFRVPVIAAIGGGAFGGGLEFVLACDFRIASTEAFFVASGVNVGLIVSFWRLPRIVGLGPAKEILLTGTRYNAEQALNWGLVTEVHPPEKLREAAIAKARRIASRAPLSVELTKISTNEALDLTGPEGSELQMQRFIKMFRTRDHKEALDAFFERRKANFERR